MLFRWIMQFNSIQFLFYFLPLFLAVYYIVPHSWRRAVLVLGSIFFYWSASGYQLWCLELLLLLMALSYMMGLVLKSVRSGWLLGFFLALLASLLALFKYYDNSRYLPAGMSFYMFQMTAYLIDVYRGRAKAQRNILTYGAQALMFPKLLSGPLVTPAKLQRQKGSADADTFHRGLQELILGLGLKVLLADQLGGLWAQAGVVGYESISMPFAWMALLSYAFRLYFDFYGYSVMAVGLGHMLGYSLPMNFLEPYSAKSVSEFYRRWHATLGAWFREYIYFPLGGSRKGLLRTILNLAVVWALTGVWHGVGGNYLIWAGFLFFLIVNEKLWMGKLLEHSGFVSHVYTVFVILLSWVPFAIGDWNMMLVFLGRLFHFGADVLSSRDYLVWGQKYGLLFLAGILFATPIPKNIWERLKNFAVTDVLLFILFWVAVYFVATSSQNPFMYFQY